MALFNETLVQEIHALVRERSMKLCTALHLSIDEVVVAGKSESTDEQVPLNRDLWLLIQVANGEYSRTKMTDDFIQRVESALAQVIDLLLGNALHAKGNFPDEFWSTDIGILVSRVRWWLSVDDLITISNAAALAFGENSQANRMRIARAMDKGLLEWFPDPSVSNTQQNRRVLRSQVERLGAQSRLPT